MANDIKTYYGTEYDSHYLLDAYGVINTPASHGKNVYLTQDAYLDMDSNGEAVYKAQGVDMAGNLYYIEWEIVNSETDDAGDACDWAAPVVVDIVESND